MQDFAGRCRRWAAIVIWSMSLAFVLTPRLVSAQDMRPAATTIAQKIVEHGKVNVAVVDFADLQMQSSELGRFLAEEFQSALVAAAKGFRVIDRTHIRTILQENRLAATGVIDHSSARQLGKIAGVHALITGSMTPLADVVKLSIKVIDASTADVLAMIPLDVPRTGAVSALLSRSLESAPTGLPTAKDASPKGLDSGPATPLVIASARGIQIEMEPCTRRASAVSCVGWVTNPGDDAPLYISARGSRFWDDQGNEYGISRVTIGNKVLSTSNITPVRLASGVRTRFAVDVDGAVSGSTFSRIVLECERDGPRFQLTLKGVGIR